MIIDGHAHIFPYLGGASGFESPETHLKYWQEAIASNPAASVRRVEDDSLVEARHLWSMLDEVGEPIDVDFRVGNFGRFVWTKGDVDYYVHVYAPSLKEMIASSEFMLAQMAWAGIDMAILQNPWLYGQLNEYFSEAGKKYPKKFTGQIQVKEYEVDRFEEIDNLRKAVKELNLTGGLYFTDKRAWEYSYQNHIDDERYFPFWEEVRALKIPVSMDLSALAAPEHPDWTALERYSAQMRRFDNLTGQFPEIQFTLVHGILLTVFGVKDEIVVPEEIWKIWEKPNIHVEILFPIQVSYPRPGASIWDYPYPQAKPAIKALYERLGPEKLIWGSDMPNVERNCTYKQSFDYLMKYCDFILPQHMDLIVGGNAARLLKLSV